ncbi:hypothetical protein TRIUR3_11755 [Triticum urartu]|uniref:Uncharacterized protein n=1 Tax=Triticum urartu TaxID=4572 RepID=M7ZQC9_TRIUA|nr:hypothetical protein TRIUR3_11755 [Triticum urartu]
MGRVCRWLRKGGSSLTWSSMRSFWMSPAPAILEGKGCDKRRRRSAAAELGQQQSEHDEASWWCIGAGGGGGPVLFVLKTYEMVDSPSTEAAVWWSDALDTTFMGPIFPQPRRTKSCNEEDKRLTTVVQATRSARAIDGGGRYSLWVEASFTDDLSNKADSFLMSSSWTP